MNRDRSLRYEAHGLGLSASGTSRRNLLARLVALPATIGLGIVARDADAKKKQKKRKKGKGGKKGNGNGGSGSGKSQEDVLLDLINGYRRSNGAGALSRQSQLDAAAQHHSDDMAKNNYFSHKLANGDTAEENIERFGYTNWTAIGENIAAGDETAKQVFDSWKGSSDHDKNMRDKSFTEIGIGLAYSKSSKYGWYWCTTFGDR